MLKKPNMTIILLGFLVVILIILIINRYIAKGISETEKQIQYFQSQVGVQQKASQPETAKQNSIATVGRQSKESALNPAVERKTVSPNSGLQNEKKEIIYQPPLNSVILVQ
jgi:uncharacterized protein YoxC